MRVISPPQNGGVMRHLWKFFSKNRKFIVLIVDNDLPTVVMLPQ